EGRRVDEAETRHAQHAMHEMAGVVAFEIASHEGLERALAFGLIQSRIDAVQCPAPSSALSNPESRRLSQAARSCSRCKDSNSISGNTMASTDTLFSPFRLKSLSLPNRIVMAPMTRSKSPDQIPGEDVARYYARRAE